jgi:uncharacterized repeat protein (TIGR03803 family)
MNDVRSYLNSQALIPQFRKLLPLRLSLLLALVILASSAFGQTFTTLYNFGASKTDGQAPSAGVVMDKTGNLFGVTGIGGNQFSDGTVFELSPPAVSGNPWTETVIHRFRGTPDGKTPLGHLIMTPSGALAGTTLHGGADDEGTIYTFAHGTNQTSWRETILHDFGTVPDDVVTPDLGLLSAPEGFYGADQGGANSTGAIYLLARGANGSAWTQSILYTFQARGSGDGADPGGELVRDAKGNFYGVTGQGGVNNLGAVYEISPPAVQGDPWTETLLYSFNGTDGTLPAGRLLLGAGGKLFGTTDGGGASGAGTVFRLAPPTVAGNPWTHTILYSFTGGNDGSSPETGVIADQTGKLYGAAGQTVFMLTPPTSGSTWNETALHNFTGPDGFLITGPLILSNNTLFGTTAEGGAFGVGTAFQVTLP